MRSAVTQEPPHGAHQLLGAARLLARLGADHAVGGVVGEQLQRDLVERGLDAVTWVTTSMQ